MPHADSRTDPVCPPQILRTTTRAVGVAVVVLTAAACSSDGGTGAASGVPTVVATTDIWADVTSHVACDGVAEVTSILPPGTDPHSFEPSLADRGRLGEADLVVANGLGLEEGLAGSLDDLDADGVPVFRVADHLETGGGSHERPDDPHLWFDPRHVASAVHALGDVLVDEVGVSRDTVDACVASYTAELNELDADVAGILDAVPPDERLLVTNHDALGYFADRYGFEIIGTVIPSLSSLGETNPGELARLAEVIEQRGVPAIFTEAELPGDDVDALADEIGDVEVVTLLAGSLGDEGSGADTYIGFLRTNAQRIADGLAG